MFWRRKKKVDTVQFDISKINLREIVQVVIHREQSLGYIAHPNLLDTAVNAAKSARSEEECIDILEVEIKKGTYWHWTDGYAGTC